MPHDEQWIDETFDKWRSRGATADESFSLRLEDRLMDEQSQLPARARRRRIAWVAAIAALVLGIAGGAYAAGDAIRSWIQPFALDFGKDGLIRDETGEVIGETIERVDGSFESTVKVGDGAIVIEGIGPAPQGGVRLYVDQSDESDGAARSPNAENPNDRAEE